MEKIENVSYYLINKSIDLFENEHNVDYLMDYDKLIGMIMLAQSEYMKLCKSTLVEDDIYKTPFGLRIKSSIERFSKQEIDANEKLKMQLLPYQVSTEKRTVYGNRSFDMPLDTKSKVILDDIIIRFGLLSSEDIQKYIDITFGIYKDSQSSYLISKDDLNAVLLPTGADLVKTENLQIGKFK